MYLRTLFCIIFIYLVAYSVSAQTAFDTYKSAITAFENGDLNSCLQLLASTEKQMSGSNPKIEALKVQVYVQQEDWIAAGVAMKNYEALLPISNRSGESYTYLMELKQQINAGLTSMEKEKEMKLQEEIEQDLKKAESEIEKGQQFAKNKFEQHNKNGVDELYKTALQSKDKELLQILQTEVNISSKKEEIIKTEIDKKNNPNNYLFNTVTTGNLSELKYLKQNGADFGLKNDKGESLLHQAITSKQIEITEYLIAQGLDVNYKSLSGNAPIHCAINEKFNTGLSLLITNKADVNLSNDRKISPVFLAVIQHNIDAIQILANASANMNELIPINGYFETPLNYVVFHLKNESIAEVLLKNGANPNDISNKNWTPLNSATFNGDIKLVALLLSHGANINQKGSNDWTALHYAVRNRNTNIVKLLLSKGADENQKDKFNRSPYTIAKERKYKDVIFTIKSNKK